MKTKSKIIYISIISLILLTGVIIVFNNQNFYERTIAKVINVENISNNQEIEVKIINGEFVGQSVLIVNTYTDSGVFDEKYKKGDRLFIEVSSDSDSKQLSASIKGIKRDGYLALIISIFIIFMLIIAGKRGVFILSSLFINIAIFSYAIVVLNNGQNIWKLSNILMILFTLISILFAVGINKKAVTSIISTVISTYLVILLLKIVLSYVEVDYAFLENISSPYNLSDYFLSQILIAGLGAIMDISVSISTMTNELKEKNPNLTLKKSFASGINVGKDIMGLMINVLLFTFIAEIIPVVLLKKNNDISLITIFTGHEVFMWYRLLLCGIGILISLPISILITNFLFKLGGKKNV